MKKTRSRKSRDTVPLISSEFCEKFIVCCYKKVNAPFFFDSAFMFEQVPYKVLNFVKNLSCVLQKGLCPFFL
jgi:hypothetical protein